jgi:ABC-type transport system substrate-binding protein
MALLAISGVLPLVPSTRTADAASTTSCPPSDVFHYVVAGGGAPNTFNFLNVHTGAAAAVAHLIWMDLVPSHSVNGSVQFTSNSITDTVTSNSNYTEWFFHIKPTAYWSNGQPVNSSDIINTWSKNYSLSSAYDFQNLSSEITKEIPVNASTAEFMLNKPDPHLYFEMSESVMNPPVSPQWVAQGPNFNGFGVTDVTDGPFYPVNYTAGQTQAVLLRNQYFQPQPSVCEVVVSFTESGNTAENLLLAGSDDFSNDLGQTSVSSFLAVPNMHILRLPGETEDTLSWNITMYPYNMTQFRQAVMYGINQTDLLANAWGGYGVTAYNAQGTVPPAATSFFEPNQTTYSYNPQMSLQLLHSIGFTTDSSGVLHYPNGTAVSMVIWANNIHPENQLAAQIVQKYLQKLGMSVTINIVSTGQLIGDSFRNFDGITGNLILQQNSAQIPGVPYVDALPGWDEYVSTAPFVHWLPAGTPENQFNSNLTALQATNNVTLETQYLKNIQKLNAQYLPVLMLTFPDSIIAYNTDHFNFPPNFVLPTVGPDINFAALSQLTPVSGTSTGSSVASNSVVTSVITQSGSTVTTVVTNSATSSSTSSNGNNTLLYAIVVIVVVVVVALGVFFARRGRSSS